MMAFAFLCSDDHANNNNHVNNSDDNSSSNNHDGDGDGDEQSYSLDDDFESPGRAPDLPGSTPPPSRKPGSPYVANETGGGGEKVRSREIQGTAQSVCVFLSDTDCYSI